LLETFSSKNPPIESANLDLGGSYIVTTDDGTPLLEFTRGGKTYYLTQRTTEGITTLIAINPTTGEYD